MRAGDEALRIGDDRLGYSPEEERHGLNAAIYFYPMIENAIQYFRIDMKS